MLNIKRSLRVKVIAIFLLVMFVFLLITIIYAHSRADARLKKYNDELSASLNNFVEIYKQNPVSEKIFNLASNNLFAEKDEIVELIIEDSSGDELYRKQEPLRAGYYLGFSEAYSWQYYLASALAEKAGNPLVRMFFPMKLVVLWMVVLMVLDRE